jgi:PPP family 3-phenylpropionic acid transporter
MAGGPTPYDSPMPYWRLSSFYFFYFAALGALVPYWGLYLKSLGFDAVAIGTLMAIPMATKFVAPYLWGWLGDHLGHRMPIVRVGSLLTALTFVAVFWVREFWPLALAMGLFSFFWNAVLPQFEVVAFNYLGSAVPKYARLRMWGSIGFILAVGLLGVAVDAQGPAAVLPVLLFIYSGIWAASLTVRDPVEAPHPPVPSSLWAILRLPAIAAFFAACFLMQVSHGPYYTFYSIYLEAHGFSKTLIGQLWALGVIAEVVVFMQMHHLLNRFGPRAVLLATFAIAAVRWLLIGGFPDDLGVLVVAQILHAATFGAFHAAAIHLVYHAFRGRHQGRGQALYSSLSYGAGGAVGSLWSGIAWEPLGPAATFAIATVVAVVSLAIGWRWVGRAT